MTNLSRYLRIWLASARYSLVRTMMFRGDLFIWALVELFWISVNVLMIEVVYSHTSTVAGWSKYEMLLLAGTSMLIQRFLMGFFWSGIFEMGRNVRSGAFDFFLAQPGDPLFMASTRKLELDGLLNSFVAAGLVVYSARRLGPPSGAVGPCALRVHGGLRRRDPLQRPRHVRCRFPSGSRARRASRGATSRSWSSPGSPGRRSARASRAPSLSGCCPSSSSATPPPGRSCTASSRRGPLGLCAATLVWFALAVAVFRSGLRRYTSASS